MYGGETRSAQTTEKQGVTSRGRQGSGLIGRLGFPIPSPQPAQLPKTGPIGSSAGWPQSHTHFSAAASSTSAVMKTTLALTVLVLLATVRAKEFFSSRARKLEPSEDRFNYFDIELLQKAVRAQSGNGNLLVSPASVKVLLAMVLEGAGGQSEQQLREALRLADDREVLRARLSTFLRSLQGSSSGYTVEMANRLFLSKLATPVDEYRALLDRFYYADIRQVDFANAEITATTINDWVSQNTHSLIDKLVDPGQLSADITLMLINAVYFKGKWTAPFDRNSTTIRCFNLGNGWCQNAYFMETLNSYRYAYIKDLNAQALEMPYEGNKFAMLIVMPREVTGINQLVRDLSHSPIHTILSSLDMTEVLLSIPRFKIDYSMDLVETLKNLDITDIFGPKANLSGMVVNSAAVHINKILHKAKIIVNEEGSEAAAASGAIAIPLMGNTIPRFRPDRPFIFFIRDLTTGSILFEGRVAQPELAPEDPVHQQQPGVRPNIPQRPNNPIQGQTRPNNNPSIFSNVDNNPIQGQTRPNNNPTIFSNVDNNPIDTRDQHASASGVQYSQDEQSTRRPQINRDLIRIRFN